MKGKDSLKRLNPYLPGRSMDEVKKAYGLDRVIKLASNENPFGCSAKVGDCLKKELGNLQFYPDGGAHELKKVLAQYHSVNENQLLVGAGLDEVIQIVSRAMLVSGDEIIVPDPTFPQYAHHAIIEEAKVIKVAVNPTTGEMDLEKMIEAITKDTKIIWLCNPNNPTGTYIPQDKIKDCLERIPEHILVISDEAYQEYVTVEEVSTSIRFLEEHNNLMIMRTFSKAYGLAGLRVGYAIMADELALMLESSRLPFNTNVLAQQAAIVALEDQEFIRKAAEKNMEERLNWEKFLIEKDIFYYMSQTNFIFFQVGKQAEEVTQRLLEKGFIIRGGLKPGWLRITIGEPKDNRVLRDILNELI